MSKHKLFNAFLLLLVFSTLNCKTQSSSSQAEEAIFFTIKNPTNWDRVDETFHVSTSFIFKKIKNVSWENINFTSDESLPFQLIDEDENGEPESVLLQATLKANEQRQVAVNFSKENSSNTFTKKTQAEISHKINGEWKDRKYQGGTFKNVNVLPVPAEHTDHSEFIRYEGPGWESDKVGYRFYLDWRNAVDIFGKKTTDMVLQQVGQDGFSSYHEPADWGMDVLKVGKSLGIGAIGFWENDKATRIEKTDSLHCEIQQNGNLQSKIRTQYYGWQINKEKLTLTSDLTIQAGSRLTRQDIVTTQPLPNICTGIVKHENGTLLQQLPDENSNWGFLATFGKQSLADDNLGMAIFFKKENYNQITSDENSHVVVLQTQNNQLTYHFAAAWEQEPQGVKSLEEFEKYLMKEIKRLNKGISITH